MRYFFVFLAIAIIWLAVITMAAIVPGVQTLGLFFAAQTLTLILFIIGFYKK